MAPEWRNPGGWLGHGGVLLYCAVAHLGGAAVMARWQDFGLPAAAAAVLAVAHARVWAAYLIHEAAHGSVFKAMSHNTLFGTMALWLSGTPYQNFGYVRKTHIAHHFDRADVCAFDHHKLLESWASLRRLTLAAEWACLPAVETIMHLNVAFGWAKSSLSTRRRFDAARGSLVAALFLGALYRSGGAAALALYAASSVIMLQVLAAHDAFQHTYEVREHTDKSYKPGPEDRSQEYEETNTYSDLISTRFPVLNALVSLNFGYHNAHHWRQMSPWWKLPAAHKEIYGPDLAACPRVLRFRHLIVSWLRHRVSRVLGSKDVFEEVRKLHGAARAYSFMGDLGVSFLTM